MSASFFGGFSTVIKVVFSIPSGAFGNATACLLAKLVGVPCSILAPNNVNDTMHRLISTGAYSEVCMFFFLSFFFQKNTHTRML